jgi:hypothetical protein
MVTMTYLLLALYLVGFVLTWVYCKIKRTQYDNDCDWPNIIFTLIVSLYSWLGLLLVVLMIMTDKFPMNKLPKPPKWL